jgi:hypothetical protein
MRWAASSGANLQVKRMGGTGFEPNRVTDCPVSHLQQSPHSSAAECAATNAQNPPVEPFGGAIETELAELIQAWPALSAETRAEVLKLIRGVNS